MDALRAANESAAVAAAAAAVEHGALIKAKADLDAIQLEAEALRTSQAQAIDAANLKIRDLESKAARVEVLQAELEELKKEKEENATKLSELEVEILELKENQESAEDERGKSLLRIKEMEEELSKAISATQKVVEEAKVKAEESASATEALKTKHGEQLKAAVEEHAAIVARLEALQADLAGAQAAHEQAQADALAAAESHARKLEEAENIHLGKQNDLHAEIKRITAELEVFLLFFLALRRILIVLIRVKRHSMLSRLMQSKRSTIGYFKKHSSVPRSVLSMFYFWTFADQAPHRTRPELRTATICKPFGQNPKPLPNNFAPFISRLSRL